MSLTGQGPPVVAVLCVVVLFVLLLLNSWLLSSSCTSMPKVSPLPMPPVMPWQQQLMPHVDTFLKDDEDAAAALPTLVKAVVKQVTHSQAAEMSLQQA